MSSQPPSAAARWGPAGAGEPPLLGRERELAELDEALDGAVAGHGGLLLITGEPGIGKTRLAGALVDRAHERGAFVAPARGWDGGGAPPYWPWQQIVRAVAEARSDDELAADLGSGARWVAQIAPQVRERLGVAATADSLESEQARFALFDAVTMFLRGAARRGPIVLLFDDMHTAGLPSLLLLAFLIRQVEDVPILVVTTHHDADAHRPEDVSAVFGELTRFGRRVELKGLDEDDLRRLIEYRAGTEPSAALVRAVHDVTEGNPFFSEEVVRLLAAEGLVDAPPGGRLPLPDGVRDAIRRRLRPLAPSTVEALEAASVIGRAFRVETLARALGIARPELLGRLEEAIAARLVLEIPGRPGVVRFSHGLVRETLYASLGATRRAELHGAVARALEGRAGGASALELAHHYIEAAVPEAAAKALEYSERAGQEALAVLAYEQAAELFERALRALELEEQPDERRRCELMLARGQALMHAADQGAVPTLTETIALARELGAMELMARAALSLGGFGLSPGIVDDLLVATLEEALAALSPEDSALRARVLVRLAAALYFSDRVQRREELVQEALAIARRLGDRATLAYVLDLGALATSGPDTTERGLEWAQELFALAEEVGDPELSVRARSWAIDLLLEMDDLAGADMAIEALDRIATDVRDPRARSYIPLHRARRMLMQGRAEEAERLINEGIQLGWSLQDSTVPILAGAQLFWLRRAQGRLDELEESVRQFADALPAMPAWRAALADVYLHLGRPAEARREYERLAVHDFADLPRDNVWAVAIAMLAELCEELGDAERAPILERLLEPLAARNVVTPEGIFAGPVTRYLALATAAREDWATTRRRLEQARAACERLGYAPMLAVLDLDEARMLAGRGEPGDAQAARRLLDTARERAAALGVPVFGDRIARVERALEGVPAAPEPAYDGAAAGVLYREGEVWRIDFEGRTLHVRDAKGMRHLALLLARPGVEVHAVDIVTAAEGSGDAASVAVAAEADLEVRAAGAGDAGALLDTAAKAAYRSRVEDLQEEIEEAESFNDPERAARAREEMDFIARELAAAVGLGGRDRRAASNAERARVNVTRALKKAVARIEHEDARLGRELATTVHTGTFCRYEPDPRRPVAWTVHGA
jgi:tetratricopeptide (TPR) repeat protein